MVTAIKQNKIRTNVLYNIVFRGDYIFRHRGIEHAKNDPRSYLWKQSKAREDHRKALRRRTGKTRRPTKKDTHYVRNQQRYALRAKKPQKDMKIGDGTS